MSTTINEVARYLEQTTISKEGRALLTHFVQNGESFIIIPNDEVGRSLAHQLGKTAVLISWNDWNTLFASRQSSISKSLQEAATKAGRNVGQMLIVHGTNEDELQGPPASSLIQ